MTDDFCWRKIYPRAVRAEKDFDMLQPGDRILIGLSGGADSLVLLSLLCFQHKKIGSRLGFTVFPAHIPGSYLGRSTAAVGKLQAVCRRFGLDLLLSGVGLSDSVFQDCFRCSLARRRLLFDLAEKHGCNKIALGHNADDLVETFLLNAFYSGRLAALNPRQAVLRGKLTLIRPLIYVWKSDIEGFARKLFGRISTPACPGAKDSRRLAVRRLLARLSSKNRHLKGNLLKAVANPKLEYLPVKMIIG
jgi:tRNA 2-thiocytidine biosynthesis protein TtcA